MARGHVSKTGVVFIISVRTGEVVYYEVLSQVCQQCIHYGKLELELPGYIKWTANHNAFFSINHEGTTQGDPFAMPAYAVGIFSLLALLKISSQC